MAVVTLLIMYMGFVAAILVLVMLYSVPDSATQP
jgi:hypothetical protein